MVDTVRAYHFGERFLVEVDIVLPEDMPLRKTHDIGEALQIKLEALAEVERAFDTRSRDSQFWPLFQLFHTLLPPYAAPPPEEISLEEFLE